MSDCGQAGSDSDSATGRVNVQCLLGLSPKPEDILMVELDPDASVGQLKSKLREQLMASNKCANASGCTAWFSDRVFAIGEKTWGVDDDYAQFMGAGAGQRAICANKNKEKSLQCTIIRRSK